MNKLESTQKDNGLCVKLSECRRAVRIRNLEREEHPHMFNFDQIYPPGTTQEAVYQYTGRPLVENTMKGFNSTLFAYGQTGSGKTHSMMGIHGHEDLEGIIPRTIKDIYKEILALETTDAYEVSMSMCEIYLEKVQDLLNPKVDRKTGRQVTLPVTMDPKTNEVRIKGITKRYCESAEECLNIIGEGNMNRATSATRMNAQSSRSHCVIILNVVCKKADGSTRTSKVKMIDLAGSETVKKTGASAQRLKEAQSINRSLSTLNSVLTALGKQDGHVPFRDSSLTKILSDSLGGNAKTSLLLAASPCTYNCLETVSTMRFGERAKKVKSNAVVNEDLTIEEYKRRNKLCERENDKLKNLLQLRDAQMGNCLEYVKVQPIADEGIWDSLIEESQFNIVIGEETLDMSGMTFNEVSDKSVVYDNKTGKIIAGQDFSVDIDATPEDDVAEAQKRFRRGLSVQSGLAGEQAETSGPMSSKREVELLETIADLKGQLKAETGVVDELHELLHTAEVTVHDRERELERFQMELAEAGVYKQKCEFLQASNDCELGRLQADLEYYQIMADEFDESLMDMDSSDSNVHDPAMLKKLKRQEQMIKHLKVEANRGNALQDSLVNNILLADLPGEKKKAIQKMIEKFAEMKSEMKMLREKTKAQERKTKAASMKERHTDQLKNNWQKQLASMEVALVTTGGLYKREKMKIVDELQKKDDEIASLKAYLAKLNDARSKRVTPSRKPRPNRARSVARPEQVDSKKSLSPPRRRRNRRKSKSPEPSKVQAN